jgi:heptosyltransferase-2
LTTSLVVQTSFLGDVVLTTPLIAELALQGPVDVVVTPAAAPLLQGNPDVRDLIVFDKRGKHDGLIGLWRFAKGLARRAGGEPRGTTTAYLAQGSYRSAALALLAGVPERVGFETSTGRLLYTRRVRYRTNRHHAERLWRLAAGEQAGDPPAATIRPRLYPGNAERAAVDAVLERVPRDGVPLIAMAPGSIWRTKRWPAFGGLAARLAKDHRIAIVGGAADVPLAAEIGRFAGASRVVDATGRLSLLASAELISRCVLLVTNDSAPQHLASAMATPTVTVFGPTVPEFGFGPLAPNSVTVGNDALPCRPCHPHGPATCPLRHWKCMRELKTARVEAVVASLLGK